MLKKMHPVLLFIFLVVLLTSCSDKTSKTGEVMPLVPQTIEVTRLIPQTVVATKIVQVTVPVTTEPIDLAEIHQTDDVVEYYDGIIAITKYYTFMGHGLHEQAYELLSSSAQKPYPSKEAYLEMAKQAYKSVNIITIQPLFEKSEKLESQNTSKTLDKKTFFVQIIAEGEGALSGSRVSGALQTLFIKVVMEDDEWKIDSFATAPF